MRLDARLQGAQLFLALRLIGLQLVLELDLGLAGEGVVQLLRLPGRLLRALLLARDRLQLGLLHRLQAHNSALYSIVLAWSSNQIARMYVIFDYGNFTV